MTSSVALLVQTLPDTVVTVAARDGYDVLVAFAAGATLATMIGALILIGFLILQARQAALGVRAIRERISSDPAVESLRKAAERVEAVSGMVHTEADRLSRSVARLSDRLNQASNRIEERIEDLNAFIEVVQGEAEGAFVEGAATARGVRAGLESLARPQPEDASDTDDLFEDLESPKGTLDPK